MCLFLSLKSRVVNMFQMRYLAGSARVLVHYTCTRMYELCELGDIYSSKICLYYTLNTKVGLTL